jgi:RHS repeat-associated protein
MKTLQRIFVVVGVILFTAQAHAVMYLARPYDPNLARWISRDPIGERGGNNVYNYVGNNPINRIDPHGLMAYNLGYFCFCECKEAVVTFKPGGNSFQWGWHDEGGGKYRLGNDITVTWKVSGNPKKCHYYQKEDGYLFMDPVPPDNRQPYKNLHGTGGDFLEVANTDEARKAAASVGISVPIVDYSTAAMSSTATYVDGLGRVMVQPADNGGWEILADLTITLKCKSSNGAEKLHPAIKIVNDVDNPFKTSFPPSNR